MLIGGWLMVEPDRSRLHRPLESLSCQWKNAWKSHPIQSQSLNTATWRGRGMKYANYVRRCHEDAMVDHCGKNANNLLLAEAEISCRIDRQQIYSNVNVSRAILTTSPRDSLSTPISILLCSVGDGRRRCFRSFKRVGWLVGMRQSNIIILFNGRIAREEL